MTEAGTPRPCAFRDCGDPACHLCYLARQPQAGYNNRDAVGKKPRNVTRDNPPSSSKAVRK